MNYETYCPINFENRQYGGAAYEIDNFTNIRFGEIRTVILNNRPYFSAVDVCRGLFMPTDHLSKFVLEAANDVFNALVEDELENHCCGNYNEAHRFKNGGPIYIDKNELYYYIDVEVDNTNQYGSIFKQTVKTIFISEPILYMIMFKSRKREAVRFKAWLATEILPSMRLIGRDKTIQLLNNEVNNIADKISNIDNKCNNIISNQYYFNGRMNDMTGRIDSIGFATNDLNKNDGIISSQITNIASGLNNIFGK